MRIDCGRGGRRAPPRAAPGQHSKNTAPYGSLFFGGWPARAAERDRVGGGGPAR